MAWINQIHQLFKANELTDVEFHVGFNESQRKGFRAHKLILSAASPVFRAELYGELREKEAIQVTDIEPETFKLVLEYIYTERVDIQLLPFSEAFDLFYASNKYLLTHLNQQCIDRIRQCVNPRTALDILDAAYKVDSDVIMETCFKTIQRHCNILNSKAFSELPREIVAIIIKHEPLNNKETEIFNALKKWGEAKANTEKPDKVHEEIEDLLPYIKFSNMGIEDFLEKILPTMILTETECLKACLAIMRNTLHQLKTDNHYLPPTRRRNPVLFPTIEDIIFRMALPK